MSLTFSRGSRVDFREDGLGGAVFSAVSLVLNSVDDHHSCNVLLCFSRFCTMSRIVCKFFGQHILSARVYVVCLAPPVGGRSGLATHIFHRGILVDFALEILEDPLAEKSVSRHDGLCVFNSLVVDYQFEVL